MEPIPLLPSGLIVGLLMATPIVLARHGCRRAAEARFFALSMVISLGFAVLLAYWPHLYRDTRLEILRVDVSATTEHARFHHVAPRQRAEAAALYDSLMGIGWTLQAILFGVLALAYQALAWLLVIGVGRRQARRQAGA